MNRMNGALRYLDRLGDPFLFLEERLLDIPARQRDLAINTLPKIIFALEGSMQVDFEGEGSTVLRPGSILVNFRHLQQTYRPPVQGRGARLRVLRLTLPWERMDGKTGTGQAQDDFALFLKNGLPASGTLHMPGVVPWNQTLHDALKQLSSRQPDRRFRTHAALKLTLLEIVRHWNKLPSRRGLADSGHQLQEQIDSYIEEHLDQPLSLAAIADAVNRSEEHVCRTYHKNRGASLFEEIKRLRLARAKYFLLCTDVSITGIAEKSGFATLAHFSRSFRENTGKSPRRFRMER